MRPELRPVRSLSSAVGAAQNSYGPARRSLWADPAPVHSIFVAVLISPAGGESAAILVGVLCLRMNDAAVHALGFLSGLSGVDPPRGLAAGLQEIAAGGIQRRGKVLVRAHFAAGGGGRS
jgi:hypothetical protein